MALQRPPNQVGTSQTLVVSEVFGPTYQGEGPLLGRVATFIRLGGCNLSCPWCDSAYTWDAQRYQLRSELRRVSIGELVDKVQYDDPPYVVITGGEPLLHQAQDGWITLRNALDSDGRKIQVETNGTIEPTHHTLSKTCQFNVSPKLSSTGMPASKRIQGSTLRKFVESGLAVFKFVCRTADDVREVNNLAHEIGLPRKDVWIMPEGTDAKSLSSAAHAIVDTCLEMNFNFTPRLHIMIWGDERAR